MNGDLCPSVANQPKTPEGWQAWHIGERCAGQIRTAGMGGVVVGLDLAVAFEIAKAEQADLSVMATLLPAFEAGLVRGIRKLTTEGTDQ